MAQEAELIISPNMNEQDLKKAIKKLNTALEKVAEKAGNELEKEIGKGGMAGIKKIGQMMKGKNLGGKAMAGGSRLAKVTSGGVIGLALAGITNLNHQVGIAQGSIESIAGFRSPLARGAGVTDSLGGKRGQTAAIQRTFANSGIDEDNIIDITKEIAKFDSEARSGADVYLKNQLGETANDTMINTLSAIQGLDGAAQTVALEKLGMDEAIPEMIKVMQSFGDDNDAFRKSLEITTADTDREQEALDTAEKAQAFQTRLENFNNKQQAKLVDEFFADPEAEKAYFEQLALDTKAQSDAIANYPALQRDANTLNSAMKAALDLLTQGTIETGEVLTPAITELTEMMKSDSGLWDAIGTKVSVAFVAGLPSWLRPSVEAPPLTAAQIATQKLVADEKAEQTNNGFDTSGTGQRKG
jgi:hypothetical protein